MVYAHLTLVADDFDDTVKLIAKDVSTYKAHKAYLMNELGYEIIEEFVDTDAGPVVILPRGYDY